MFENSTKNTISNIQKLFPVVDIYIMIQYTTFLSVVLTIFANKPQQAGTAKILNTADPTIVPIPKSPSVTKVPTLLMNNSGLELATAINVAPAMSSFIRNPENTLNI